MKVKEAIDILELIRDNVETPIPKVTKTGLAITALTGGIEALEKRIPMKVEDIHVDEYFCPACGAENLNGDFKRIGYHFCPMCGQAIYQEE